MGLILRYLAKETYTTTLAVTSILVLIIMAHQFVHYLGDAAGGRLTPKAVAQMMGVQIPLLLGFMLPLGFFLGILLCYGRLYVDNEMTILAACGISKLALLNKSLQLAGVVACLVAIIMIWVEPKMAWYRDHIIAKSITSSPIERISAGRFQLAGNWVLYTEGVTRDHQKLSHIFAATVRSSKPFDKKVHPIDIVVAENAFQKVTPAKETFIVLTNGRRYLGVVGDKKYQIIQFSEYGVRLPEKEAQLRKIEECMSFKDLWKRRGHLKALAELQWRIAMPLSVLILTLFAVPLSEVKPRQGRFGQMLPAIIIYVIYINLLFLGRAWIEKSWISPEWGLWWIHALMLVLAAIILYIKLPWRYR
jgi:lipopolysaccharide export system permease protein